VDSHGLPKFCGLKTGEFHKITEQIKVTSVLEIPDCADSHRRSSNTKAVPRERAALLEVVLVSHSGASACITAHTPDRPGNGERSLMIPVSIL